MESAWPILLFLAFLFGSMLLILVCGYFSREEEKAEQASINLHAGSGEITLPRFFVELGSDGSVAGFQPLDEPLLSSIEEFLRREHGLFVELVARPSVAKQPAQAAETEGFFDLVEGFLRAEQRVARAFVSEPSVESLYGDLQPATA